MSSSNRSARPFESRNAGQEHLGQFVNELERAGLHESQISNQRRVARHLLFWLVEDGTEIESVDDAVLQRFNGHKCTCSVMGDSQWPVARQRQAMTGALKLVRFLELNGQIRHPGELPRGFQFLESFLERLAADDYRATAVEEYRHTCGHFLIWLHQTRTKMEEVDVHTVSRFAEHDCLCLAHRVGTAHHAFNDGRCVSGSTVLAVLPIKGSFVRCRYRTHNRTIRWRSSAIGFAGIEVSAMPAFAFIPATSQRSWMSWVKTPGPTVQRASGT